MKRGKRGAIAGMLALIAVVVLVACASSKPPKGAHELGQPMPSASTSAEPIWLHN